MACVWEDSQEGLNEQGALTQPGVRGGDHSPSAQVKVWAAPW